MSLEILPCTESHLRALTEIYNDVICTSTAVYAYEPVTIDDRRNWWNERIRRGFPVWVASDAGALAGFAAFGDFRGAWPGYRFTVEHTVHVRAEARGRGIGQALMRKLFASAVDMGKHVMIGAVDAENEASIRFHERLGFQQAARLPQVGFKFDRWLDLVFMHKQLNTCTVLPDR